MRRGATIVLVGAAVLLAPMAAFGGSVTFHDPDDFEVAPDVHSTTKLTFLAEGDGHRVRIKVRGELGPNFRLRVLLDSRMGERADFVMIVDVRDLELDSCRVRHLHGPGIESRCGGNLDRVWWGVARADLDPDKRIRWRVVGLGWPDYSTVTDRAPDTGWYT
jgi:hypothetical protein